MNWTRLSFWYLASYLLGGGLGLVAAPALALGLLGAEQTYPASLARLAGGLMLALGILVVEIVRKSIEPLYRTTLVVRLLLIVILLAAFLEGHDRLFLVLTGIVAFGVALTTAGIAADRGRISAAR